MNILVLGGGGREHAISWALAKSPRCTELYVAPGNGGTANIARNVKDLNAEDAQAVLAFAQAHNIELVVIGPEAPLVAGVADVLREAGIPVFGPDAQGAQLEGSKTYSKRFMDANGIPTARYQSFTDAASARAYCEELGAPLVVKADGLAAGKGVVVAETLDMALDAVEACINQLYRTNFHRQLWRCGSDCCCGGNADRSRVLASGFRFQWQGILYGSRARP